jgi:hypothetical protein
MALADSNLRLISGWSKIRQIAASEELASDCIFPLGPIINM